MHFLRSETGATVRRALLSSIALHLLVFGLFFGLGFSEFFYALCRSLPPPETPRINAALKVVLKTSRPVRISTSSPISKPRLNSDVEVQRTSPFTPPSVLQNHPSLHTQLAKIRNQIEAALVYPKSLQRRHLTGQTTLQLQLTYAGQLQHAYVLKSSGHSELDELALQAAQDAAPFPETPLPSGNSTKELLQILLPITFKIKY